MSLKELPLTLEEISEEERTTMKTRRVQERNRLVRISPGNILLPYTYASLANHFYNFEFRKDDIIVATFPKSGTVWMAETLWTMTNFDQIHTLETTHMNSRTFFLDIDFLHPITSEDQTPLLKTFQDVCPEGKVQDGVVLQLAKAENKPRILMTHLQFKLYNPSLLSTSKVVYVARNPKDACVSLYYFLSKSPNIIVDGSFSEFAESFMEGQMNFGPYWDHLEQTRNLKDHPNLHFVFYEDMKSDVMRELQRLRTFLNLDLTDDQLKIVSEATNFENMKKRDLKRPLTNMKGSFFRKGTVGDWKNMASPELDAQMDRWIEENSKNGAINFKYAC